MGEKLPTGQLSTIPWRRSGVKYTNNEAYFDVIEEIDAIVDKSGNMGSFINNQNHPASIDYLPCLKRYFGF